MNIPPPTVHYTHDAPGNQYMRIHAAGIHTYHVLRDRQWVVVPGESLAVHPVTGEHVSIRDLPWEEAS
jgi:hypothetical protein